MTVRHVIGLGSLSILLALPAAGQSRRVDLEAADCSRMNVQFDDLEIAHAVQHATVPLSAGRLDVEPEANGGVSFERGTGSSYSVTACIAVGATTQAEAQQAADSVKLSIEGSRVRVQSPSRARSLSVQLIVETPPGADVRAATTNGPIGLRDVSGKFEAHATNGPIGLRNVRGTVTARAQNGPISVDGSAGDFDLQTSNGPISVNLSGTKWEGRLDARASNGPLDVRVPSNYGSGVEVSTSFNSPWTCHHSACRGGNRDWDERSRTIRFGPDPVVVRISTVNGPVTIDDGR
jgi:DUF4097 and DUF4098 domain-containing protein YvlB